MVAGPLVAVGCDKGVALQLEAELEAGSERAAGAEREAAAEAEAAAAAAERAAEAAAAEEVEAEVEAEAASFWRPVLAASAPASDEAAARLRASLQEEVRSALRQLGLAADSARVEAAARGGSVARISGDALAEWVLRRCVAQWQSGAAAEEEERRREEAEAEAEAAEAADLAARRQARWAAKNQRLVDGAVEEERLSRSSLAVAIDDWSVREAARREREGGGEADTSAVAASPPSPPPRRQTPPPLPPPPPPRVRRERPGDSSPLPTDDVLQLPGIGPSRSKALRAAGVATVAELAATSGGGEDRLSVASGVPLRTLVECARRAAEAVAGNGTWQRDDTTT